MKRLNFVSAVAGTLLLLFVLPAAAAADEKKATTLDDVVVSVTQTRTSLDKIGGNSVTVITSQEIEEKKYHTLEEIIKTVPGITITSNGGAGTKSSVFMRGADSKNTLVLIDGIMVNDPSGANRDANLADISLDNVERIEVVRGAMSVMYGSNATAGVINVITGKGTTDTEIYALAEAGSYGTWKLGGGASGAVDRMNFSISASALSKDGFSVADADNPLIPHAGNTDEADGYDNLTLSGSAGFDLTDHFRINASLRYVDADVALDDYSGGFTGDNISSAWVQDTSGNWINVMAANPDGPTRKHSESELTWGQVGLTNDFADGLFESILAYKFSRSDRRSFDNNNDPWYDYKGGTDEFSWQGNVYLNRSTLSFGAGYFIETMESLSSGVAETDATTASGWIQDQIFFTDSFTLIAGMRLDNHDSFGSKATFRVAPSYDIQRTGTVLKASFGTGFRSPSLYELYSSYGNPDLEPEESIGWDIGFEQNFLNNTVTAGATLFRMDYRDRIGYDFLMSRYNQLPGTTRTHGVEMSLNWLPREDLSLGLTYTYTHTEDPDGNQLVRRPYNQVGMSASWRVVENASVTMDARWVDDRKASPYAMDMYGNSVDTLDAYWVMNLAASYDITRHVQLYARIDNLFDEYYEEAFSYATAGLSGYAGFKVRW